MRRLAALAVTAALALAVVSGAGAVGPWLGTSDGPLAAPGTDAVSFTATAGEGSTLVAARSRGRTVSRLALPGTWGLPLVTMNGAVGGVSTNGRTLVLSQPYDGSGGLQRRSSFAVLGTSPLEVRRTISLAGDFGFDALSPDGRWLYLIQHVSEQRVLDYRVRAYDLRAGRLLPGVVADRRQRDWTMTGMPVARAASPDGRWVYTLYSAGDNYPFVHALDTRSRTAVCVGLPWDWSTAGQAITSAGLSVVGGTLRIAGGSGGARFALDRTTFSVRKL
jgi:hypothetical protein